jgi:hypothetical protein
MSVSLTNTSRPRAGGAQTGGIPRLRDNKANRHGPIALKNPLFWRQHLGFVALSARQSPVSSPHVAKTGTGSEMSFANFRRFWAVAANRNHLWLRLDRGGAIGRA